MADKFTEIINRAGGNLPTTDKFRETINKSGGNLPTANDTRQSSQTNVTPAATLPRQSSGGSRKSSRPSPQPVEQPIETTQSKAPEPTPIPAVLTKPQPTVQELMNRKIEDVRKANEIAKSVQEKTITTSNVKNITPVVRNNDNVIYTDSSGQGISIDPFTAEKNIQEFEEYSKTAQSKYEPEIITNLKSRQPTISEAKDYYKSIGYESPKEKVYTIGDVDIKNTFEGNPIKSGKISGSTYVESKISQGANYLGNKILSILPEDNLKYQLEKKYSFSPTELAKYAIFAPAMVTSVGYYPKRSNLFSIDATEIAGSQGTKIVEKEIGERFSKIKQSIKNLEAEYGLGNVKEYGILGGESSISKAKKFISKIKLPKLSLVQEPLVPIVPSKKGFLGGRTIIPKEVGADKLYKQPVTDYGLIGRSPEQQIRKNIIDANKNAGYVIVTGENINPKIGYNLIKRSIREGFDYFKRNDVRPYGLIGRSPESYQISNIKSAVKNAGYTLYTESTPTQGYRIIKNQLKSDILKTRNVVTNKVSQFFKPVTEFVKREKYIKANTRNILSRSVEYNAQPTPNLEAIEGFNIIGEETSKSIGFIKNKITEPIKFVSTKSGEIISKAKSSVSQKARPIIESFNAARLREQTLRDIEIRTAFEKYGIGGKPYLTRVKEEASRQRELLKRAENIIGGKIIVTRIPTTETSVSTFGDAGKVIFGGKSYIETSTPSGQVLLLQNPTVESPLIVGGTGQTSLYSGTGNYELTTGSFFGTPKIREFNSGEVFNVEIPKVISNNQVLIFRSESPTIIKDNIISDVKPVIRTETSARGDQSSIPVESFAEIPLFKEQTKVGQKESQIERFKQQQKSRYGEIYKEEIKKRLPVIFNKKKEKNQLISKVQQAFNVVVFRRGKEETIAKGLPKGLATKAGVKNVLSTLRASFKLKPTGTTTMEDIPFKVPTASFTTSKYDKNRFVQRKNLRFGARSETKEVQIFRKQKAGKIKWF